MPQNSSIAPQLITFGRIGDSPFGFQWLLLQAVVEGGLIVDVLAPALKLVIEVDGPYHEEPARKRADARRQKRLVRAGYRVLRLSAVAPELMDRDRVRARAPAEADD